MFKCLVWFSVFFVTILCDDYPKAQTALGTVSGYLKTSFKGRKYAAFEGIPYAEAPVGSLRFEKARPAKPWNGVWNATVVHTCLQAEYITNKILGQEDCLYVNVYVPRTKINLKDKLEVIIHIHGGGFMFGSPNSYTLPDYLMDREFIFVTISYRLGILGFLSTGDDILPGNNGLKDQQLALKWIKDNIENFGGNSESITLTGFSAGAASSHYHFLAPKSRGLFNRGISHSGCSIAAWAIHDQPLVFAQRLSSLLGCPTTPSEKLKDCIKQRSPVLITSKIKDYDVELGNPLVPVGPVVEHSRDPFLPKHPYAMLRNGEVNNVPWILSSASEDGLFPAFIFEDILHIVDKNWNKFAPYLLDFYNTHDEGKLEDISRIIKDHYFGKGKISLETHDKLIQLLTDRFFTTELETAAKLQAKANLAPVYYYVFDFRGNTTFTDLFQTNIKRKGVCHGDDIIHLYGNVVPGNQPDENDLQMIEMFLDMMESFSKDNVPKFGKVKWRPTGSDKLTYLHIKSPTDVTLETGDISSSGFWRSLGLRELDNYATVKDEL